MQVSFPPAAAKRHRQETMPAAAGGGNGALEDRLARVEKLLLLHDTQLRTLESHSMKTYILPEGNDLGAKLMAAQQSYNQNKPNKGPHPWGPPRRAVGNALCGWLLENNKVEARSEFHQKHKQMSSPQELDTSVNFCSIKLTYEKKFLLRVRATIQAQQMWFEAYAALDTHVLSVQGQVKSDPAPPGPLVREIREVMA
eukprot:TRINITY_DN36651_c0_g3_i1.p2 TRINITY_DN36651_c0_g3~~TRINITY_DN36651_c0_g3_i1.p2  ORF type:complete len:198 (-),score=39.59 TRINITY_DN36651_c0_g3_i1:746-1339(-)